MPDQEVRLLRSDPALTVEGLDIMPAASRGQTPSCLLDEAVYHLVNTPSQDLIVPKGCSTVLRPMRLQFGMRFTRSSIASGTASCSRRLAGRSLPADA